MIQNLHSNYWENLMFIVWLTQNFRSKFWSLSQLIYWGVDVGTVGKILEWALPEEAWNFSKVFLFIFLVWSFLGPFWT